jgi:hypothetical protein
VADGKIDPAEYGLPLAIDFTDDKNAGVSLAGLAKGPANSSKDLSAELSLAYTTADLFVAVQVQDDVLVAREAGLPHFNDAIELFIDGDRLGGDLINREAKGSREGFQAGTTAKGRKYGVGIGDKEFAVRTSTFEGGYIVEFRIPLAAIDIADGMKVAPPSTGTTLRFNLAIVDNDQPVDDQQRYCVLWSEDRTKAPFLEGDGTWPVDLHLARPVNYELAAGPKEAAIDAETGVLTWNAPQSVGAENVTIRVRDKERPEITSEASFMITTTARR